MTVIHRFGGGLNLNVHFHMLVLDGVFFESSEGALEFRPLPPPTDDEVGGVLARIAARVQRMLDPSEADGVLGIRWSTNRPRWPASAAPRCRGGSRSARARLLAGVLERGHPSGPALCSGRKSCDTLVVRAVPGGGLAR